MRTLALLSLAVAASVSQGQKPKPAQQTAPAREAQSADLLPDEQIQQVLNRLTFGARAGDAEKVRTIGIDKWIDAQLHPERIPDPRVDSAMSNYRVYALGTSEIIHDYGVAQQLQRQIKKSQSDSSMDKRDARRDALAQNPQVADAVRQTQQFVGEIQSAKLARAVTSERQLNEVMVDFW